MLDQLAAEFPEHTPRPAGAPKALEGIRIVDFSHFIAGPFATMILADMGAEVIKIEAPDRGDDLRRYPPVHPDLKHGAPFLWTNRNKQSVAIDLKSAEGLRIVHDLIAKADVVVENFSTGVMQRFRLDYESCRKLRPEIVYCSVSAYGREGAFADRLGFDPIAQVESGFVSMNGYADREGVRALSPVMDISTAMMACNAILGALVARERSGLGQAIEVSLFDNAVLMTGYATLQHEPGHMPIGCVSGIRPHLLYQLRQRQDFPAPDVAGARPRGSGIGRGLCDAVGSNSPARRALCDSRGGLREATLVALAGADAGGRRSVWPGAQRR